MPFKVFVAGSAATAADVNTYLMNQAVIVCTSGTRPGTPVEGMSIYETDTDKRLFYDGATWNLPKNVAGGTLGYAQVVADQLGVGTSDTDLTGLTVAVTVGAGRRIRVSYQALIRQNTVTTAFPIVNVKEGATSLQRTQKNIETAAGTATFAGAVILQPSAGAHTYKLTLSTSASTTDLLAAASYPAFVLAEDIGGL